MGGDQAVDLAEEKRVLGLEKLHFRDPGASTSSGDGCHGRVGLGFTAAAGDVEDDERDVVPGIPAHDVSRSGRPVEALDLAVARVLDHHGRRIRRLAVSHFLLCEWLRLGSWLCEKDGVGWGYYMEQRKREAEADKRKESTC